MLTNALQTVDINLDTAVHFHPPSSWNTTNTTCGNEIDHFTALIGATASFSFTGDRLQISTVGLDATAGTISMILASQNHGTHNVMYDLHTDTSDCGLQVDHFLDQDTYNVTLTLVGPSAFVNSTSSTFPEFHILDITYYVTDTLASTNTMASVPVHSTSSATDGDPASTPVSVLPSEPHTGPIVGGVIGGIVILFLLAILFSIIRRRRASTRMRLYRKDWILGTGRHSFNPTRPMNAVYMSELSPRTAARNADMSFEFDSAKLLPYVKLDDHEDVSAVAKAIPFGSDEDDVKSGENPFELVVPSLAYTSSKSGNVQAGIRSRSPAPKEREGDP
ncbi:hypothetical protein BDY19DRAFT_908960 [Irpex rosettiformis]|uniref:Uncharacterized protein n=1 Tax=Irpex rosettiformis TaxID=378272 RepID=A0ACB8TU32_9APHY|nr:hypothetical protein BDY19DRAFT_908960 [Irpex rosettiformis]